MGVGWGMYVLEMASMLVASPVWLRSGASTGSTIGRCLATTTSGMVKFGSAVTTTVCCCGRRDELLDVEIDVAKGVVGSVSGV